MQVHNRKLLVRRKRSQLKKIAEVFQSRVAYNVGLTSGYILKPPKAPLTK